MSALQDQARNALNRGRRARRSPATHAETSQLELVRDADGHPVTVLAEPALITITESGTLEVRNSAGEESE